MKTKAGAWGASWLQSTAGALLCSVSHQDPGAQDSAWHIAWTSVAGRQYRWMLQFSKALDCVHSAA